ncbi:spastin-like protein [Dinothrombium tinctorium]|uniref:Spastin-like protein n=1 Tax=Dinothrombium tinctorium TaxID=1965070 RepID=A0A443RPC1_9ACAR|nr:spastin-like protein [Dinothrombium tinctorium]
MSGEQSLSDNSEVGENSNNRNRDQRCLPSRGKRTLHLLGKPLIAVFMLIKLILANLYLFTCCLYDYFRAYVLPPFADAVDKEAKGEAKMTDNPNANKVREIDCNSLLLLQKQHHKNAYTFISKALEMDEENSAIEQKGFVIDLYKKGLKELERGIAIEFKDNEGPTWDRARKLREKMQNNLIMVQDRLDQLDCMYKIYQLGANLPHFKDAEEEKAFVNELSKVRVPVSGSNSCRSLNAKPLNRRQKIHSINNAPIEANKRTVSRTSSLTSVTSRNVNKLATQMHQIGINNQSKSQTLPRNNSSTNKTIASTSARKTPATATPPASRRIAHSPSLHSISSGSMKARTNSPLKPSMSSSRLNASSKVANIKGVDRKLVQMILNEIYDGACTVNFNDIAGQTVAKQALKEMVILPTLRPEIFTGLHSISDERILVMGATNRPQELDEAALRRFTKRVYITLPDFDTRITLLSKLLKTQRNPLSDGELQQIASMTDGYSGSDLTALAKDAALGPIREMGLDQVKKIDAAAMRRITFQDFCDSLKRIRKSVSPSSLQCYEKWNQEYGDVSI